MNKYIIAAVLALAAAVVIVAINWPDASGVEGSCAESLAAVKGFKASGNATLPLDIPLFAGDDGHETTLADHAGKALVLNFWATWCPPCVAEMPTLVKLKRSHPKGIDVMTVSEDRTGAAAVEPFLMERKWDDVGIVVDRKGALARALKIDGLPTTLLVSADGKEVARMVGPAPWDGPRVAKILKECLKPTASGKG